MQHPLALAMHVSAQKINDIVHMRRGITADSALRLAAALGTTPEFWMGLQSDYDLQCAQDALGDRLSRVVMLIAEKKGKYTAG